MTGGKDEIRIPPSNLQIFRGDGVSELQQSLATRVLDNGRLVGEDQDIVNEYKRVASNHEEAKERRERPSEIHLGTIEPAQERFGEGNTGKE